MKSRSRYDKDSLIGLIQSLPTAEIQPFLEKHQNDLVQIANYAELCELASAVMKQFIIAGVPKHYKMITEKVQIFSQNEIDDHQAAKVLSKCIWPLLPESGASSAIVAFMQSLRPAADDCSYILQHFDYMKYILALHLQSEIKNSADLASIAAMFDAAEASKLIYSQDVFWDQQDKIAVADGVAIVGRYDASSLLRLAELVGRDHLLAYLEKHKHHFALITNEDHVVELMLAVIYQAIQLYPAIDEEEIVDRIIPTSFSNDWNEKSLRCHMLGYLIKDKSYVTREDYEVKSYVAKLLALYDGNFPDSQLNDQGAEVITQYLNKDFWPVMDAATRNNVEVMNRLLQVFAPQLASFESFSLLRSLMDKLKVIDTHRANTVPRTQGYSMALTVANAMRSAIIDGRKLKSIIERLPVAARAAFINEQDTYWKQQAALSNENPRVLEHSPRLFSFSTHVPVCPDERLFTDLIPRSP
jgi:hypothetical protein